MGIIKFTQRGIVLFYAATITFMSGFSSSFPRGIGKLVAQCSKNEYSRSNICCQKCPAGTHVVVHCSVNHGPAICKNCTSGNDFTAYPNGLDSCLPCRACREDEIIIEECGLTRNTHCECKPGTYLCKAKNCTSIGTCSTCLSCPKGQVIKHPCNTTSNTVCEAPIVNKSNRDWQTKALIIGPPICAAIIFICMVLFGIRIYLKKTKSAGILWAFDSDSNTFPVPG